MNTDKDRNPDDRRSELGRNADAQESCANGGAPKAEGQVREPAAGLPSSGTPAPKKDEEASKGEPLEPGGSAGARMLEGNVKAPKAEQEVREPAASAPSSGGPAPKKDEDAPKSGRPRAGFFLTLCRFFGSFFNEFLFKFCPHLPLPFTLLFLTGLAVGQIGRGLGLAYLVWHEDMIDQFFVGVAMMLVALEVVFVGYLLRNRSPEEQRRAPALWKYAVGIGLWAAVLVTGIYLVLARLTGPSDQSSLNPLSDGLPQGLSSTSPWALLLGATITALLFLVVSRVLPVQLKKLFTAVGRFMLFFRFRVRKWFEKATKEERNRQAELHGFATVSFLAAVAFYTLVFFLPGIFSPVVCICFLLHLLIGGYGYFAFGGKVLLLPVLAVVFGLIWAGGLPLHKHRVPGLDHYYDKEKPPLLTEYDKPGKAQSSALIALGDVDFSGQAFGKHHPAGKKRPLVVVCVSGGGIRAAAWTLAVLERIEEEFQKEGIAFPYHIRLISGASGGMVGAAYYSASLPSPGQSRPPGWRRRDYERITADSLSPVVQQIAYGDFWKMAWPFELAYDRGTALEEAWSKNLDEQLDKTFADLAAGEKEGWRPSLIFSPTLIEDGRRLLISNLNLHSVALNAPSCQSSLLEPGDPKHPSRTFSWEALELFKLFPDACTRKAFKLATAARLSASFPFVSPAAVLPTEPRRRVVDAGYYDNYGVSLAASWLMGGHARTWLRKNVSGVVLIQIRDARSADDHRLWSVPVEGSDPLTRGFEELTSPLVGLYNANGSTASFHGDEQLQLLTRAFNDELQIHPLRAKLRKDEWDLLRSFQKEKEQLFLQAASLTLGKNELEKLRKALVKNRPKVKGAVIDALLQEIIDTFDKEKGSPFFATVLFELPRKASLSWYLTEAERRRIHRAADDHLQAPADVRNGPHKAALWKDPRIHSDPKNSYPVSARIYHLNRWWKSRPAGQQAGQE
jgi:hypothetical protein